MSQNSKIKTLAELAALTRAAADDAQSVVHCHGVFDLLHIGHIRYLQKAKQLGDLLVVTLTPDRFVNKGPHRPAFTDQIRAATLAALDCVDYVSINEWPTAAEAIEQLQPAIYAKGAEFRSEKTPELLREEEVAARVGTAIEFIEDITSSSSHLINNYLGLFSDDVAEYLQRLKATYPLESMLAAVAKARRAKILVVGEAIIDENYACKTLGRSMKAPIIAAQYESHERYAAGSLAVANHVAAFCDRVGLVAMVGAENPHEEWIRSVVASNVSSTFVAKSDAPTIIKRRYRESYFGTPLFEINYLNDKALSAADDAKLCDALASQLGNYDAVVVADYGHSMLSENARHVICDEAKFVAVNPQVNAANVGYQTIAKYPRADFVVLAQQELELECRNRNRSQREMILQLSDLVDVSTIVVTLGKRGCLCYNRETGFHEAPALATKVVDREGAADAFFAMASLCAVANVSLDLLAFLGNVAGAEAVGVVGNSRFLEELPFTRHIQSLLK